MLLVFLRAAVIAISLYGEIPRVAFESQRAKEELLIERGEQYARGIKVFVKKNNRYPKDIEELEKYNNRHYLRKRFVDPITGKSEWRMIHVGPGGVFTDSVVNKPQTDKDKKEPVAQNFIGENAPLGGTTNQPGLQTAAPRRRASEMAGLYPGAATGTPGQPEGVPGQPGTVAYPGQ